MNNPGVHVPLCYPAPLASHAEVLADRHLFELAHASLRSHLGNKLVRRIPIFVVSPHVKDPDVLRLHAQHRKEFDLHLLYKAVTKHGGLQRVNEDRKLWAKLLFEFDFPRTVSMSKMRHLYTRALYHFEQLYLHQCQGPLVPAPAQGFVAMHALQQ